MHPYLQTAKFLLTVQQSRVPGEALRPVPLDLSKTFYE